MQVDANLIASKASNATNRLATAAYSLRSVFRSRGIRGTTSRFAGVRSGRIRLGVPVVPLQGFAQRGRRVIDKTPRLEEIENPTNGSYIGYECLSDISKGDLLGRAFPKILDNRISKVLVNPRIFRGRP